MQEEKRNFTSVLWVLASYLVGNKTNYLEKLALFIIEREGEKEEKAEEVGKGGREPE